MNQNEIEELLALSVTPTPKPIKAKGAPTMKVANKSKEETKTEGNESSTVQLPPKVSSTNEPKKEEIDYEAEIENLSKPCVISLSLAPNEQVRVERLALDAGLSVEAYIQDLIRTQLNKRVGKPFITRPSVLSGLEVQKPVVTPTFARRKVNKEMEGTDANS